eukprot:614452-Hanusia_phi.AAC.1
MCRTDSILLRSSFTKPFYNRLPRAACQPGVGNSGHLGASGGLHGVSVLRDPRALPRQGSPPTLQLDRGDSTFVNVQTEMISSGTSS